MNVETTILADDDGDSYGIAVTDDGYNIDDDGSCSFTTSSIGDSTTLDSTLCPPADDGGEQRGEPPFGHSAPRPASDSPLSPPRALAFIALGDDTYRDRLPVDRTIIAAGAPRSVRLVNL